ncbi:MAG: hypothetical protein WBD13_01900 [Burkholderiaceae bacterium]
MTPAQLAKAALTYYGGLVGIVFIGAPDESGTADPVGADRISEPVNDSELLGCVYRGIERIDAAVAPPETRGNGARNPGRRLH